MDPFANRAVYSAKARLLSQSLQKRSSQMPPPPAYHLVVDPNNAHTGIPIQTPFGAGRSEEEDEEEHGVEGEEEEHDVPEVTINAATQVRGHGNIISVPQMDSMRIAGMVYCMLSGVPLAPTMSPPPPPPPQATSTTTSEGQPPSTAQTPPTTNANTPTPAPSAPRRRSTLKAFPKMHITVNCGATVIGDRNVVGPGLGDIARNIQVANQRAQMQQMQQMQARANQAAQGMVPGIQIPATSPTQMPTPPMSRSASGDCCGIKRKAGEEVDAARDAKKTYISGS